MSRPGGAARRADIIGRGMTVPGRSVERATERRRARPPRLIFLHIPKTGGTTLRQIIERQYAPTRAYFQRGGDPLQAAYLEALRRGSLEEQTGILASRHDAELRELRAGRASGDLRLVAGHYWYGLHEELPGDWVYSTMLRDPIDRVLSLYAHRVRYHGVDMDVETYLERAVDFDQHDGQTRRFAPPADRQWAPCTRDHLELAEERLRTRFAIVGLTERFDESLVLMARSFGWRNLGYAPALVSESRPRPEDLSARARRLLERQNELDLELFGLARQLFDERVAREEPLDGDLEHLRRSKARYRRFSLAYRAWRRARRASAAARWRRGRAARP